ncbi:hypothetical protein AgCh_037911 [Apium graveolens]
MMLSKIRSTNTYGTPTAGKTPSGCADSPLCTHAPSIVESFLEEVSGSSAASHFNRPPLHSNGAKTRMSIIPTPKGPHSGRSPLSNLTSVSPSNADTFLEKFTGSSAASHFNKPPLHNNNGAKRRMSITPTTKGPPTGRSPLSNLTSVFNSSTDIRSPLKSNENIKKSTITTANMNTHFTEALKSSTANSSNKEYSTIRDTEIPDADCYSDDENEDNVQWEYDVNNTAGNRVTLEYAFLGPPSVKCSKCEAWMWKEECNNPNFWNF